MQAQQPLVRVEIKVIVPSRRRQSRRKAQPPRHPQVQQQQTAAQIQQQIFATPAHPQHLLPEQLLGRAPQGPTQRLAQAHGRNVGTGNLRRKTLAGDLNLGQFRHGSGSPKHSKAWIIMG